MLKRPRRNRRTPSIRDLVQETNLSCRDFVLPLFLQEKEGLSPIASMEGHSRLGPSELLKHCEKVCEAGIRGVALFPQIDEQDKDSLASFSHKANSFYLQAIASVKKHFPDLVIFSDVAMDPYSSDGHDGIVKDGKILNDETLEVLAKMAVAQAQAGADYIAPSDMMDGRVAHLRQALDEAQLTETGIMAYSAKYASAFYGPFRDALDSAPKAGDKKTYQMNPANVIEAKREVLLDLEEGADMVMVKPALSYLDIIRQTKEISDAPVTAYFVSGEYAMIKAAASLGYLDEQSAMLEALVSIKRAGADLIFTYAALEVL